MDPARLALNGLYGVVPLDHSNRVAVIRCPESKTKKKKAEKEISVEKDEVLEDNTQTVIPTPTTDVPASALPIRHSRRRRMLGDAKVNPATRTGHKSRKF